MDHKPRTPQCLMRKFYTTTLFLTLSNLLFSEESPSFEESPCLSELVLIHYNHDDMQSEFYEFEGLRIDKSINFSSSILAKKLTPLINHNEINETSILQIKNEIIQCYQERGQNLLAVEVPEQDISTNALTMIIVEPKVGEITYCGNRWFSDSLFKQTIRLEPGDCIDEDELLNNLAWLNHNPFHYSEVILSPGSEKGLTDLEIVTKDRFPLRVYGGANNNGVESTGTARYLGGFVWGNAFFCNDLLNYQFTSNNDYNRFHSHTLNYTSYLAREHIISIYGGYAQIHPDIQGFSSHGKDAQASLRYKIPLRPLYTKSQSSLYFGFDYKYFNSALFFVGELEPTSTIMESNVNVTEAMLGYRSETVHCRNEFTFEIELFGSFAKWLPHQNNSSYAKLRPDAKPRFFYGNITLGEIYTFKNDYSMSLLLRCQGSTNTLIPSEQFALGGFDTVRGYENNVFISDNAVCANFEMRTRPFSFFNRFKDELIFLAFVDYGWGYNYHAFDGITKSATLLGVGPGVRYNFESNLSVRVDYGFRLHDVNFDSSGLGFLHAGAMLSF